jgi:eukaryotic-like serine/threonine-protein kinase
VPDDETREPLELPLLTELIGTNVVRLTLGLAAILFAATAVSGLLLTRLGAIELGSAPDLVDVPAVTGQHAVAATNILESTGFVAVVLPVQNVDVPAGIVIRQAPLAGERAAAASEVVITVSAGDDFASVPDVRGSPVDELHQLLAMSGLVVGDVGYEEDDARQDEVIGQLPAPGEVVPFGSVVHVMASSGPPLIEIPDVRDLPEADAVRDLRDQGFQVVVQLRYSHSIRSGSAMSTEPNAEGEAPRGDRVVLYISRGAPPATTEPEPEPEPTPAPTTTAPGETFEPVRSGGVITG